jgi:hypothetical protein
MRVQNVEGSSMRAYQDLREYLSVLETEQQLDQQSTDALAEFQKAEIAKWWPIIKAANVKGE